ncbi:MAG: HAMP domain-containing histidine kinase [Rhodospirillales bacterium]|nr:HAMP domain-containing histidine kinase [Rhodospirillales bacterium]
MSEVGSNPSNRDRAPTRRHFRLGAQLFSGLAIVAVIVAAAAGMVVRHMERNHLISVMAEEHEKKFELLVSASLDDIISEDLPRLETTMSQLIAQDPNFNSAHIANEADKVLFSWSRPSPRGHDHSPILFENDHRTLRFARHVVFAGEKFGTIVAGWDTTSADHKVNEHAYLIALAIVAICGLLGSFAYLIVSAVAVAPIRRISSRLRAFEDGAYDAGTILPAFASTELRYLDQSVDALGEFLVEEQRRTVELQAAKEAAEAANCAKSDFLAVISHELRSPLHVINGFSEIMGSEIHGPLGDPRYREYADHIVSSGKCLLELINNLLDMSRIEAGKVTLGFEEFGLADLIAEALELLETPASSDRAEIVQDLEPDLPHLMADKRRIRQVLLNLLSNAVKFTPSDGHITVSARWRAAVGVTLQVRDTGAGIAEHNLNLVLEPFGQVEDPLSREHEGTGLGLPLAKALIELHGGEMQIESKLSLGTTVTVILPPELVVDPPCDVENPPVAPPRRAATR